MKLKAIAIILLLLISISTSCLLFERDNSVDLGDNYRYVPDYPPRIIHHTSDEYNGIGTSVVPPLIISYTNEKDYILAKNQNLTTKEINYWLIHKNKDQHYSQEPIDSIAFFKLSNRID